MTCGLLCCQREWNIFCRIQKDAFLCWSLPGLFVCVSIHSHKTHRVLLVWIETQIDKNDGKRPAPRCGPNQTIPYHNTGMQVFKRTCLLVKLCAQAIDKAVYMNRASICIGGDAHGKSKIYNMLELL